MIRVRAPARLCLLGEHQDYFGLSVISGGVDLFLEIRGERISSREIRVELPDLGRTESFPAEPEVPYPAPRSYLRSGWNVAVRAGWAPRGGVRATVRSEIPIAKGASSSSALTVAWIRLLAALAAVRPVVPEALAELAYRAEVVEFDEPGGRQDHYAIALGGLIHLDCTDPPRVTRLAARPEGLILADSGATKETLGPLQRIKTEVHRARRELGDPDLRSMCIPEVAEAGASMDPLTATLRGRDLTAQGRRLLEKGEPDPSALAELINAHHRALREGLGVSTPAIEALGLAALQAGALSYKVLGSGGGGLLLIQAPRREAPVLAALEAAGGRGRIMRLVPGAG